ncbi:hypothetical protein ADK54_10105 [Streptomyces sp. WM6378]|nr:hypothetical protein ADK54_10105 [Streptomyces sp. WM6378]
MARIQRLAARAFFFARFGTSWWTCVIESPGTAAASPRAAASTKNRSGCFGTRHPPASPGGPAPRRLSAPWRGRPMVDGGLAAGQDGRADVRHLHRDYIFVGAVPASSS